jgi:AcrR family transcriptional regulator
MAVRYSTNARSVRWDTLGSMTTHKDREVERSRRKIETAALGIFTKQGYHGTSMREIADKSGFSIGNIYNHYPAKEDLFIGLVKRYEERMAELRAEAFDQLGDVFQPAELQRLALSIRDIVYKHPDYWRLMYIDVVEFGNKHFAHVYQGWSEQVETVLGERLRASAEGGPWAGLKPSLTFTIIYLQFFTYYLVETLFNAEQHLGVSDEEAIQQMITMMTRGIWLPEGAGKAKRRGKAAP